MHFDGDCPLAWTGKKVKSFELSSDKTTLSITFLVPGGFEYTKDLSVISLFEDKYGKPPQDEEGEMEM